MGKGLFLPLNVLTMFDQNDKSRCKFIIYNGFLILGVIPLGLGPRTHTLKVYCSTN